MRMGAVGGRTCSLPVHHVDVLFSRDLQTKHPRPPECADPSGRRDHCLAAARPGHLPRAPRCAIPSPRGPRRPPPGPLCMRQRGRLGLQEGPRGRRKGPRPGPEGEKAQGGTHSRPWPTKNPRPAPALLGAPPRPCSSFPLPILLVHPALSASLPPLSLRRRAETCSFLPGPPPEKGSRKKKSPLWRGREPQGESISHSPVQLLRVQPRSAQPGEQYASSSHACAIWHPFASTPKASAAASRLTIKGDSGSGALPGTTSMHSRYFNVLQIMWLIIL